MVFVVNKRVKASLSKLSLCDCGYPVLDESIALGTEYEIDLGSSRPGHMTCGGCKKRFPVTVIFGEREGHDGMLPLEIFSIEETE